MTRKDLDASVAKVMAKAAKTMVEYELTQLSKRGVPAVEHIARLALKLPLIDYRLRDLEPKIRESIVSAIYDLPCRYRKIPVTKRTVGAEAR